MMMKFSKRAEGMTPSATLAISATAAKLKAEGKAVLSFSQGEPDFVSPPAAMNAAREAIDRGETHYTPNSGTPKLKTAIAGYYKRRFGLDYDPSEIIVSPGAKPVLYEALQSLVDEGDEVIVLAPAWVSYVEQIKLAGGKPVIISTTETGFEPTAEALERAIGPKTRGIMINTPNNPTGTAYSEASLKAIADAARSHDLWILYDEIYERLVYGVKHMNILNVAPDIRDRVLIVNGVSKAFCMTGWRIGYGLGPAPLIKMMDKLQGHMTSNAASISQWAAVGALEGPDEDVERCREIFERRRDLIFDLLSKVGGLSLAKPTGAFYAFFDVRGTKLPDDTEFCKRLLDEQLVALVPGAAFLMPGFVRMSYACAEDDIRAGVDRIAKFVASLG